MTQTNPTVEDQIGTLTQLVTQLLHNNANAAPSADVAPAPAVEQTLQSEVAPPPVGSIVRQDQAVAGQEHTATVYGLVVEIDPTTNTARVAWSANTTDVRGDELTKVE